MRSLPLDYAVRNLGRRPLRTILTGGACALVAAALVGTSTFADGMATNLAGAGDRKVAILLSSVAERDVIRSTVLPSVTELVAAEVPGIVRKSGVALVSGEIHMGTNLRLGAAKPPGEKDPVYAAIIRAVTPRAFLVHDSVTLIEGSTPGANEVLVGRLAAKKLGVPEDAVAPGRVLRFEGGSFKVAGIFAAPRTTLEAEIWANLAEVQGLSKRDDLSAVFVRVEEEGVIDDLQVFAKRRLDLELECIPSTLYYKELAEYFGPIRNLAWVMAALIAVAVLATGVNTLNTTVQDRMRELATLRATGYTGAALARSLLVESALLTAGGGLVGVALARIVVAGTAFRIGMTAFSLEVGAASVLIAIIGVLTLGILGTIPAAARVLRLPVAVALKEN